MKPEEYIRLLEQNIDKLPDLVKGYVYKRGSVLRSVKQRFLQKGIDGYGNKLGTYSSATIRRKKKKGQITSHVTLRDSGQWYESLFLRFEGTELILDSTDLSLTSKLVDGEKLFPGYGQGIMEFSNEEQIMIDSILDEFYFELSKKLEKNIDIEI